MTYSEHMEQGLAAAKANEYAQALACFQAACLLQPEILPPQLNRGNMALLVKDTAEAEAAFSTALRLDPTCVQAMLGMARLRLQQARWS